MRPECSISPLLFNVILDVLASARDKIKGMLFGKEEIKLSLFPDDIIYIENPNECTKPPPKKPHSSNKWVQQTHREQDQHTKSIAFPHTNSKQMEVKSSNTTPFTIIPKNLGYLGINLIKHV